MAEMVTPPLDRTFCEGFCQASSDELATIDENPERSLQNLGISGRRGCPKCACMYDACTSLFPQLLEKEHGILIRLESSLGQVKIVLEDAEHQDDFDDEAIYLLHLFGTPAPDWLPLPPIKKTLTSRGDQFAPLLLEWLGDCDMNHRACFNHDPTLPTRVIDVGDNDGREPFLHISHGHSGQYVALSHCWGDAQFMKTETGNIAQNEIEIPMSSLPKNFQDAIIVSRAIGIRYVWIDSLCIIQDDGPDWETESSKMATIYQNAYVVLIASNAADSHGGLWNTDWETPAQSNEMVELQFTNQDGKISSIIARRQPYSHENLIPGPYLEYDAPSPLATRAWAFQEELLARRSIFFTGKELLWKCQQSQKCECMEEDLSMTEDMDRNFWQRANSGDMVECFGGWRSLLATYSKKSITFESDRFPAISGLAKYMQGRGLGEYLAGFWKEDILVSILWLPKPIWPHVKGGALEGTTYRRRALPYRAPTWSWVSLEWVPSEGSKPRGCEMLDGHESPSWRFLSAKSRLVDASCEPAGSDPTGSVKSGYIILQVKSIEVLVKWENRWSGLKYRGLDLCVHWDIDLEIGAEQTFLCVLIASADKSYRGLVLERSESVQGTFERVGLLESIWDWVEGTDSDPFREAEESVIKVV